MHRTATLFLVPLAAFLSLGADDCDPPSDPGVCEVGGRVYGNGDTGVPAPDGCNTCTCVDGRLDFCTERACPPPPSGACLVGGVYYANGDGGVPAPDGCNTCTCVDGMLDLCTERACPPPTGACTVGGVMYANGDTRVPAPDGCNTCTCVDGRLDFCTEIACPPGSACTVFDETYSMGWAPSPDGCNTCSCEGGRVGSGCTEAECGPIPIVTCDSLAPYTSDPYTIGGLRVDGDTLLVDLSWGGGCEPHFFRLCYDPAFLESYPVQVSMRLDHDGQDDPCDAIGSETRAFDLTPLRDAYRRAYGTEHDTVRLRLGEGTTYTF
jgi:hypothetical protein